MGRARRRGLRRRPPWEGAVRGGRGRKRALLERLTKPFVGAEQQMWKAWSSFNAVENGPDVR